ncbi:YbaY family lipoprotein [Variovorax sp. J22P271]|uniref:YbaY family lipoprotein n=1 Tax=Variovorax davisae TaxID=3053515 RepID=UPI002577EAF7|nr:YbaY family lipoprotein [Variovorax sp. J22P271]MDM0035014.1 YbaY family lipoprotein [Variovorax sp. J22P271]
MKKRSILFGLGGAVAVLLAGCAAAPGAPVPLRVTGSVAYRERIALDPEAEVVVQLLDVSRMDVAAVVLAEQRIRAGGRQVPFQFELGVDPARIDPRMRYTVSARILQGGQLLFVTDTAHPVLTQGQGSTASLMLIKVAR